MPAARRPALIGAGNALFATSPGGRVVRLNGRSLRQLAIACDASRPRALAVLGRTLIVADDKTLYRLRSDTLAPVGASAFGPAPLVGGGGKSPIVAATGRRVCLVGASGPGPCVRASFVATGVGARPGGTVLAVDGAHGALATFRRAGKKLVASGSEIVVGKKAHGPVVVVGSRAYVPVSRGIAVVDLATRKVTSTIPLQVTPGAPAIVGGTIVAPLPARGGVALISSGARAATPRFVATGPLAYAAGAGTGSLAYVANAGDGTITLVDVSKGKALRRLRISSLRGAAVPRAIVRRGSVRKVGNLVTLTLHLGSGALDRSGLLVRSRSIAHGTSVVELWQGGIASAIGRVAGQGVTATLRPSAGRVIVRLSAAAGAFTALAVGRANGGRDVVLLLTARPPATTGGGGSSTGGGGGSSSGGGGGGGGSTTPPRVAVAVGGGGGGGRRWWRRRPRELLASRHPAAAGELLGVVRLVEARDLHDIAGVRRLQEPPPAEVHADVVDVSVVLEEDEVARHEVGTVDRNPDVDLVVRHARDRDARVRVRPLHESRAVEPGLRRRATEVVRRAQVLRSDPDGVECGRRGRLGVHDGHAGRDVDHRPRDIGGRDRGRRPRRRSVRAAGTPVAGAGAGPACASSARASSRRSWYRPR